MDISYTPGKANVMTDALSHKAYCSELEVQIHHPLLYEEICKLNIEIVPQGHVNSLVVKSDLDSAIKFMQCGDSDIQKIFRYLESGRPSFFTLVKEDEDDNVGMLYFKGCLVVHIAKANWNYARKVMKEAHDTPLSIHLGRTKMYQDIRQRY